MGAGCEFIHHHVLPPTTEMRQILIMIQVQTLLLDTITIIPSLFRTIVYLSSG